uniref:RNase H type-1 domain-containing protein n=1 Tax=Cajanus cajan TaxID=3821 RepID=A0A151R267_CAJCA|nr:hypothetical protein KK1_042329 [Cajanus cajan]
MKIFLWRLLRDCLPSRQRLQQKGVPCTSLCCQEAQTVWQATGIWQHIKSFVDVGEGIVEVIFSLLGSISQSHIVEVVVTLGCIWRRRNAKVWDQGAPPSGVAISQAKQHFRDWQAAQARSSTQRIPPVHDLQWKKPHVGTFTCNIDAALFQDSSYFGYSMCIRNDHGQFLTAKTGWAHSLPPVHEAEATALLTAIQWIENLSLTHVTIESDCKSVLDALSRTQSQHSEYGSLLNKCRGLLHNHPNLSLKFIPRQANRVAHCLARASRCYASSHTFEFIPSCIVPIILNEMT